MIIRGSWIKRNIIIFSNVFQNKNINEVRLTVYGSL